MMHKTILASLAMAGVVACGRGSQQSAADRARSVELARADSIYKANDVPVPDRPAPSPAPVPAPQPSPAPAPASASATPRTLTLASGTRLDATTNRTISSRTEKAGGTFTANVGADVKDSRGRVVVPAGSIITLSITELQPADDKSKADGKLTVLVTSVTVGGQTYPVSAGLTSMEHTLKGRGVGATEVEKTAAGVVVGGIAGRIIGGNSRGTIIGAVVGGAAGAAVANQTANRDVVVAAGTPLVVTLEGPLTVTVR